MGTPDVGWPKRSVPIKGRPHLYIAYCGMTVGTAQERLCPPCGSVEPEKAAHADRNQRRADHIHRQRETRRRMQIACVHGAVITVGRTVHDDLLVEIAVGAE